MRVRTTVLVGMAVVLLAGVAMAVDRSKFRTCKDTSFCRRHRNSQIASQYYIVPASMQVTDSSALAELRSSETGSPPFKLDVRFYRTGTARVRVTEITDQQPRWETPDVILEDSLIPAGVSGSTTAPSGIPAATGEAMYVTYPAATGASITVVIQYNPFKVELYTDGTKTITVNDRGMFHFEHRRSREVADNSGDAQDGQDDPNADKKIVDWGEDGKPIYEDGTTGEAPEAVPEATPAGADEADTSGMWEESWSSHRDVKKNGPTSVSTDITFHGSQHVYGIPEHATTLSLKDTNPNTAGGYTEPYRLYNLDVFEYEMDEAMALYGSIPFMISHSATHGTCGAFWHNPSETFVDVYKTADSTQTRWISEAGIVDLMLLPGPRPKQVFFQYASLTGSQALPPVFAIAYHQCRWNYKDETDVFRVDEKFEEHNFPYDVLWLDIEHTDGKRYFTWDHHNFPNPAAMQRKLAERGRKMVTIVDPHIKRDSGYHVHSEATSKGYYIKKAGGGDFEGWCWPGSSSYLDFTNAEVRDWWADQFSLESYKGSTEHLYTWNDMNEPSVFNGPEVSMDKSALNLAGAEHREWHNLYGIYQQMATAEGQVKRSGGKKRPFVLSRAFYAGSQRFGAIWTGDNAANWEHLRASAPMLLTIGLTGLTFAGADVGGFFGNPDAELLERWYQAGSWQPFFRAHAHIDTKRREPWLFGGEVLGRIRKSVATRYSYLPYWYTLFFESHLTGAPVMRPLWVEYPEDTNTFAMEDQWMVGSDVLVKPVTSAGARSVDVYFPGTEKWYDVESWDARQGPGTSNVDAPLDKIPVFQRAGSIVPRRMRLRRCTDLMVHDPFTLNIVVDSAKQATGALYLDDGSSFAFQDGLYRLRRFTFADSKLTSTLEEGSADYTEHTSIERLVVVGLGAAPNKVVTQTGTGGGAATFNYDASKDVLTVRKPMLPAAEDWTVTFVF